MMIQNKDENNKSPNQGKGKEPVRYIVIGPMDSSRWSWWQPLADLKSRASAKAMYRYHGLRAPRAAKIVTKRKQETGGDQMAEMCAANAGAGWWRYWPSQPVGVTMQRGVFCWIAPMPTSIRRVYE